MNKPFGWSLVLILILLSGFQHCSSLPVDWDVPDEIIADAIYIAEGGVKASVPYGILSVKVKDEADARRICLNTIRNTKKRWEKAGKPDDFVIFLGKRYAPIGARNDSKNLNQNWAKNVKFFIKDIMKEKTNENRSSMG